MKRLLKLSAALALGALLVSGCASTRRTESRPPPPRAFALAVTVNGGLQPTPAQWATVQAAAARELAAYGWVLVSDLALADRIIRVDFTPDPADPEHSGRAVVLGVRTNPYRTLVTIGPVRTMPTYTYLNNNYAWSTRYDDPYYTYSWHGDGYVYDGPSGRVTPVPPAPVAPPPAPPPQVRSPGHGHDGYADVRRTGISRHGGSETRTYHRGDDSSRYNPPPSRSDSTSRSSSSNSGSSSGSSYSSSSSSSSSESYSSSSGGGSSYSPPSSSDGGPRDHTPNIER